MDKIKRAFALFDDYNKKDPVQVVVDDIEYPKEYFFSQKMYEWILKLRPEPSEALLLASRCQHIGRWEIPRTDYPEGKAGYLRWRSDLAKYHAEKAGSILQESGFDRDLIEQVKQIVLKKQIKLNPDVQVIEDALCLVFLQFEYEDFIKKHDDLKLIRILQKTWAKMSEQGHAAALNLQYSAKGRALIERALAG